MPVREDAVYYGEFNIEDGAPAVRHFYDKLGMKPDLIVCANDGMALGVRQALTRRGLRVPGDVAVTGFDDTRLSPWLESPLTTVRQPVEASGRKAVEMLKEYMDGKSLNAAVSYQKTELIVRGSCGCRPGDSEASSRKSAERGEGSILDNDAIESFITRDKERVVESALSRFCNEIANNLSVGGHAEREAEILETLGIDSFCLASFDDGNPSMDGASRLIIAWVGGRRIELPAGGLRFPTRAILPEAAFPRRRFTLIGEALACGEECFGILWLPAGAIGNNIYEVFRVRLSDAIRTAKTMRMLQVLNARLEEARIKLEELSITDELTGHYNRRGFMTIADQQIAYCRRRGEGFWILYIDLDGLKAINDRYSHEEGDVAIRRFGDAISSAFRESDIVARFGGDEFTIMAPNTPKGALERLVGRLAKSVSAANLELARDWELSISLGAFYSDPKCAFALDVMMDIADKDLHAAKRRKKAQG
jgi:diguanylate cyclase (GGDEF)-like protein